jgi:hypothetical protein
MASELETIRPATELQALPGDFADRLDEALQGADRERRRRVWLVRLQRLAVICLLVGPIIAWRLMQISPAGVHVYVGALAWLAFFLDAGVHADSQVLSYLGLQLLPSIVGFLLFALLTFALLTENREDSP